MASKDNHKKELNLLRLLPLVKQDKRAMLLFCLAGLVLGVLVAIDTPKVYKSSVMLAPEATSSNTLTSNISSLASMVGLDMNLGGSADAIFPEIYPDVISSTNFIVGLFDIPVYTIKDDVHTNYYDYLKNHNKHGWWTLPKAWLAQLVAKLRPDDRPGAGNAAKADPFMLNRDQSMIADAINKNINCSVDKKTSVITIEVSDQDPLISAMMADSVKVRLQNFIVEYRTKKARNDLQFMEGLFAEAREQYVKARQQYAAFSDSNQDLLLQSFRSKQDDLENDMQLKYNAYTQVYEQLQLSRAKVQEQTPVFTVVKGASVPIKHSSRSKASTVLLFLFLAFAMGMLFVKHFNELYD